MRSADIGRASPPTQALRGVCPHDCYDTCGLVLHVAGDRLVRVEGALDPPVTRGFVCRKVSHYPERRHHPDRILYPLQRVGPKGSGRFRRTSWAEALAAIAAALNDIRTRFGGEAILPYSFAGNMGVLASGSMDARFFHALGASRLDRTICTASANATLRWMFGVALGPDPETMVDAGLVILWGTNPMATNIHEVPLLDAARHQGAEIVTIDPLSTATARRYRPHVKLRPNTDLELALGVGNALLARGLADLRFIERYTGGIHAFQERARGYTLERTAAVTGIPRADLESLVHLMATRRPLLIRAGYGVQRQSRSAETVWALGVLSCLTGAWHDVGGGLLLSNGDAFPLNEERLTRPDLAPGPTRVVNMVQLGEALTTLDDPPIKALIVYNANPAATAPDQTVVLDGLRRDDLLVVVHEQMPTDTTRWADWVLPAAMGMEVLDLHTSYWHRYLQLNRPALPPPGEAVSNPELFRRLARAVGLTDPALAASDEDLIRDALATDHPWLRHITWDRLRDNPVARVGIDRGARPFVEIPPPLPGGRIRLDPPPFVPNTDGRSSGAPDDAAYPFHLLSPSRRDTIKSTFGNMPGLSASLPPELLMHPDDVRRGGYRPGEVVEVVSAQGRVRMRLTASDVPGPGTVVSYAVTWAAAHGDRNVNRLTSQRLSDYGGGATFYSVRVAVRRVDPAERREPNDPGRVETGPGRDGTHLPGPATVNATIPTQGGDS